MTIAIGINDIGKLSVFFGVIKQEVDRINDALLASSYQFHSTGRHSFRPLRHITHDQHRFTE